MAIHQLVHTLSYGDAISGEVLALQRCLREMGEESEIFAMNVHPLLEGRARDVREMSGDFSGEVILHYSLGSPLNPLYESMASARRTLIFHNITPAKWFDGVNTRVSADIRAGVAELPKLLALSDRVLADSKFNAEEIEALGFRADVLDLPIDPKRWDLAPNEGIVELLRSDDSAHFVHVGRLAPNKCIEDIIKIFAFYHEFIDKKSKLWLSGIDIDTELYSFALKRLVTQLHLEEEVNFVGCMADSELRALYENGSIYLCMSEHEGFCLPVIEAMHFGLPVIAYASSALPQTVGNGGILVREKRHAEIAELCGQVLHDHALGSSLIAAGKERVRELSYDRFAGRVKELFFEAEERNQVASAGKGR